MTFRVNGKVPDRVLSVSSEYPLSFGQRSDLNGDGADELITTVEARTPTSGPYVAVRWGDSLPDTGVLNISDVTAETGFDIRSNGFGGDIAFGTGTPPSKVDDSGTMVIRVAPPTFQNVYDIARPPEDAGAATPLIKAFLPLQDVSAYILNGVDRDIISSRTPTKGQAQTDLYIEDVLLDTTLIDDLRALDASAIKSQLPQLSLPQLDQFDADLLTGRIVKSGSAGVDSLFPMLNQIVASYITLETGAKQEAFSNSLFFNISYRTTPDGLQTTNLILRDIIGNTTILSTDIDDQGVIDLAENGTTATSEIIKYRPNTVIESDGEFAQLSAQLENVTLREWLDSSDPENLERIGELLAEAVSIYEARRPAPLGETLTPVGDLNGDGQNDLLAKWSSFSNLAAPPSYGVFLWEEPLPNNIPASEFFSLEYLNAVPVFIESSETVRPIGDLNGDGRADLAVFRTPESPAINEENPFFTLKFAFGSDSGLSQVLSYSGNDISGIRFPAAEGYKFTDATDVRPLGDIDGDGFDDFALNNMDPLDSTFNSAVSILVFGNADVTNGFDGTRIAHLSLEHPSNRMDLLQGVDFDGDGTKDLLLQHTGDGIGAAASAFTNPDNSVIFGPVEFSDTSFADSGIAGRVFLGDGGVFTVSNPAALFGRGGSETILLTDRAKNVELDGNIDRIDLPGSQDETAFQVVDGQLQIRASGEVLVSFTGGLNQPVEVRFADGDTTLSQTGATSFALADATGSSVSIDSTATASAVVLGENISATAGGAAPQGPSGSAANVFLQDNASFTVSDLAQVFGRGGGQETVRLTEAAQNVQLDGNVEQIELTPELSASTFQVVDGQLQISVNGTPVATFTGGLNQPVGLQFANGEGTLEQTGAATFELTGSGGQTQIGENTVSPDIGLVGSSVTARTSAAELFDL